MTSEGDAVVAQVVLRPASGRRITGDVAITAATLQEYLPSPEDADAVVRALAEAGFEVGPLVGIGMSLSGPRRLFESFFGTKITSAKQGGWLARGVSGAPSRELPLGSLPSGLARRIHAVSFEVPAEPVEGGGDWP